MPTLKLVLTDLQVDSFATSTRDSQTGTVHAHAPADAAAPPCTANPYTCTCPVYPSCAGNETCEYTVCGPFSCPAVTVPTIGVDADEAR